MMFRKIWISTLSFTLLLGLGFMQRVAYSYPACENEGVTSFSCTITMYKNYQLTNVSEQSDQPHSLDQMAQSEAQPTTIQNSTTSYAVSQGDTLYKIARSFDISVDDLINVNGITNPNVLSIGQNLTIPLLNSEVASAGDQPKLIKKVLNTTLTAYTAGFESTGKKASHPSYGITYSGSKAKEGRTIAVDPNVIPLGSTVFIEGIGIRKAEDIGSAIRGSRIDVFMNDLGQAQEFGVKKNVKVYLLDKGNV